MARHEDRTFMYRRFDKDNIALCVRWSVKYRLSYCDLAKMMAEQWISASHETSYRSAQRFVPDFEERWNQRREQVIDLPFNSTRTACLCWFGVVVCVTIISLFEQQ